MRVVNTFTAAALCGSAVSWAWTSGYDKSSHNWNRSSYDGAPWTPHTSLPQNATNGFSTYGTLGHQPVGPWVDGPMPHGCPWGDRGPNDTNPYDESKIPNTGMTRYYQWTITKQTMAPDGVEVPMLVVNGQFPGPLIEANWGDWIEVSVDNQLDEGTAMHWHGFLQKGTPWYDGVPGVTQCPIAPGKSFTYRFRAELFGTSWWHSHWSAQYMNGLVGPIIVHGPVSDSYDIDVGPVMLTDWFHSSYYPLIQQVFVASDVGPIFPPAANNMLINGKGNYDCKNTNMTCTENAGLASFKFKSGKKHLLRLINMSAEAIIFFSIDGHKLKVVANDFVAVQPYETDLITLAVGQRTDIIVQGKANCTEAVWMRMTEGPSGLGPPRGSTGCSLNDGISPEMVAAIYYEDSDTSIAPNTSSSIDPSRFLFPNNCANVIDGTTVPMFPMPVKEPSTTLNLTISAGVNGTGQFVWYMNNRTFSTNYNDPTLLEAKLGNLDFPEKSVVYDMGTNSSVRIIMQSVGFPASHPMHIHGHNMQVLAAGSGVWDGVTITNPENPQRRDTQLIMPAGYLVVQIDLDNPGVWPFHCHIAWHISEGMNINLLEQTPTVLNDMSIPYSIAQTCRDWSDYSGSNVVNQIDSGL